MIWLYIVLVLTSGFLYAVFFGAPFVPAFSQDLDGLLELAGVGEGTEFVDLGSGNGKVLVAAAKRGAVVTGYEINFVLWLVSLWRLRKFQSSDHSARVYLRSMWQADLSRADVVFMYLHTNWMDKMQSKLVSEAKRGSRVVSYVFTFSGLKQIHKTRNAHIYEL